MIPIFAVLGCGIGTMCAFLSFGLDIVAPIGTHTSLTRSTKKKLFLLGAGTFIWGAYGLLVGYLGDFCAAMLIQNHMRSSG